MWYITMHLTSLVFLCSSAFSCILLSLTSLYYNSVTMIEWEIMTLNSSSVVMTLIFDWISFMFLGFVLFISSMVLFYSGDYMEGDKSFNRFMYLVLAFVLSMGALIVSPNMISILLGWDGLGLVSYALVIFYQNEKSANAGMLTVLSNRVGDVAILLSISLMFMAGGWNFILYSSYMSDSNLLLMKCLVVMAAMTKSAQIPFSAWLPAAMAAPTPVSALVHSSTLVTAGVYLLIRFSPALMGSEAQSVLLIISCLTMFMAGLGANFEYDLKKIIALSTLSQLGVMLSILALGFADLAFFHLLAHALFKALLFMCAGVVIHAVKEYQDIRCMGSLVFSMPLTSTCMNLANLALCGMPFLAGFYSKDLILEVAFMSNINLLAFVLYALATGLTVCYSFRLVYYSLTGLFNLSSMSQVNDKSVVMTSSMMSLSIGGVTGGAFLSWVIFPESYMICLTFTFKVLALALSVLGALIGYLLNIMSVNYSLRSLKSYSKVVFMGSMWFMPFLSTFNLSHVSLKTAGACMKVGDYGWSEHFGGQGLYSNVMHQSGYLQVSQNSSVSIYMKSFLFWVIVVFFIMI
ncbi:NADH dehydrogenase subunit 5 (mitochondrion) [Homarus americanus]|uniref:NADH-ubiquinone oxidoreductase chain 5 n=1 Tax=Homarus americanus TaxID=6706 RepID=F6KJW6_HOMAM|nr:NADH dehydrogenase subunit 5 [Homarus americanus]ADP08199.1 NADH dehydrogenase subunit 5 [Homarus americanus]